MRLTPIALLALAAAPQLAAAQQSTPPQSAPASSVTGATPVLTLDEAIALARRENPNFQATVNNRRVAAAGVRSAYGGFLPQVSANLSSTYREGGQQFFAGSSVGATSDIMSSSYGIGARLDIDASTFTAPRQQRATLRAVEEDITSSSETLRAQVVQQYVTVLQRQATAALQDSLLVNVRAQLELARARADVGAGTTLDVKRAEVAVGQQEVLLVRARNEAEIEMLRLFQFMGVDQPANVQLTTQFVVEDPRFTMAEVMQLARERNPQLRASKARETEAAVSYRNAQGQYLPTLSLQTGWGGYTSQYTDIDPLIESARLETAADRVRCLETQQIRASANLPSNATCSEIVFTDAMAAQMRSRNDQYPFDFTRAPWEFTAILSLPIFNGFVREQRVQEAAAYRADARHAVRAQELALTAGVSGAYLTLVTAKRAADLQTVNAATAREALRLAEERYRVGANTFVDVTQARAEYERAENERISAIFEYHRAFALLESAVGRPLR